ncbi:MAG: hypothetical protein QXW97_02555 [Candidatus Pacearchaeota archaeon]
MKKKIFLLILFISILIPFISAQWDVWSSGGFGYFNSPLYFLQNVWVLFAIIFMIFFAIIFYTVNKSFKNSAISGTIALGLSTFISITIAQRGWLYSNMGGTIGSWLLVISVLIAFGFLIRFSYESFGRIGTIAAIFLIWAILHGTDPYNVLPYELTNNYTIITIYEFISGWIGLIFLIIISAIIITARVQRRGLNLSHFSDYMFGR